MPELSAIDLTIQSEDPIVLEMGFNFIAPSVFQQGASISDVAGLQAAIDSKQTLNSRLTSISSQANPATIKLFQLNPNGSISFIDPPSAGGSGDPFRRDDLNFAQYPTFALSAIVNAGSTSSLFINGQKQTYVTDYVVSGSTLTWVGALISFPVISFEFYYQ